MERAALGELGFASRADAAAFLKACGAELNVSLLLNRFSGRTPPRWTG